jgi:hypothetical protein
MPRVLAVCIFSLLMVGSTAAQQPFLNDDADVATLQRWHFETSSEYDILPRSSLPNKRQFTQTVKFTYGIFRDTEIGMDFPLIKIFNEPASGLGDPFGLGDTDFSIKHRFREEKPGSKCPAITASLNIEPPTGSSKAQLGSGLIDYYLNSIFQKTVSSRDTLRVNAGATFAGNTLTGAVGIKTRGTIFTGGGSITHQFTQRLDLGSKSMAATQPTLHWGVGNSRNNWRATIYSKRT